MNLDTKKLQAGLENLSGYDFEQAEKNERMAGNMTPDITFSKSFQARLAAKALSESVMDIRNLPIKEYTLVTSMVGNFLLGSLAEEIVSPSEAQPEPQTIKRLPKK